MPGCIRKRIHLGFGINPLVMLSKDQIDFLSTKEFFQLKKEADEKVGSLLYSTQGFIQSLWNTQNEWHLPSEASKKPGKVSKGNNYKGFPYQVFDYPSVFNERGIFSFRVVVWYGNFFSVNLILTKSFLEFFQPQLQKLAGKGIKLLINENIWETDLSSSPFISVEEVHMGNVEEYFKKNESIRLFREFSMNQINSLDRLTVECFNDWFTL